MAGIILLTSFPFSLFLFLFKVRIGKGYPDQQMWSPHTHRTICNSSLLPANTLFCSAIRVVVAAWVFVQIICPFTNLSLEGFSSAFIYQFSSSLGQCFSRPPCPLLFALCYLSSLGFTNLAFVARGPAVSIPGPTFFVTLMWFPLSLGQFCILYNSVLCYCGYWFSFRCICPQCDRVSCFYLSATCVWCTLVVFSSVFRFWPSEKIPSVGKFYSKLWCNSEWRLSVNPLGILLVIVLSQRQCISSEEIAFTMDCALSINLQSVLWFVFVSQMHS